MGGRHELELVCERDSPWGWVLEPAGHPLTHTSPERACTPSLCALTHTGPERACTPSLCDTGHLEPHGLCRCLPTPLLELGSLQCGPSSSTDSGQTGLHLTLCHPAVAALLD